MAKKHFFLLTAVCGLALLVAQPAPVLAGHHHGSHFSPMKYSRGGHSGHYGNRSAYRGTGYRSNWGSQPGHGNIWGRQPGHGNIWGRQPGHGNRWGRQGFHRGFEGRYIPKQPGYGNIWGRQPGYRGEQNVQRSW